MRKTALTVTTLLGALGIAGCGPSGGTPGADGGSGDAGAPPLELVISPDQSAHPISPLIYGINGPAAASAAKARLVRLGGTTVSAYNWEINATNGGRPRGYANMASSAGVTPGAAVQDILDAAAVNGAAAMVTAPIGDYVAADRAPGDVHGSGDYLATRFKKNKPAKGPPLLAGPDLSDGSVYQDEFAIWARGAAGETKLIFSLDDQPELWAEDHAEIHPDKTTYDEIVTRTVAFAQAIKAVAPDAPVTGYGSHGWEGYVSLQNAPDSPAKGEFVEYYLDQMKAAETKNGGRLLDYLDLHWWPEAQGGGIRIISPDTRPDVVAARLQAPRSLWDSTYHEASWIGDLLGSGEGIALIPRMKAKIASHYPGTKLAISAWYYGAGGDISGALATADVLGIFGREGVDLAAVELPDGVDLPGGSDAYTLAAFQSFLDFDGAGAHFGDTSVSAVTSDTTGSSVYASTDSADPSRLVIVAINKGDQARTATITISGSAHYGSCAVFTLTAKSAALGAEAPLTAFASAFTYSMPALSVSVIVPQP